MKVALPEIPTPEALLHSPHKAEPTRPTAGAPVRYRNMAGTEADRLLYAGHIIQDQHCTLDKFRQDLMRAGMVFTPRAGLVASGTSGHAQFIADNAFRRVKRVTEQMKALYAAMLRPDVELVLAALMQDARVPDKRVGVMTQAAEVLDEWYS